MPVGIMPTYSKFWQFRCVCPAELLGWAREDSLPVVLHIHDRPAPGRGFVQGFVQLADVRLAVVGPFALGVGVMDDQSETRAAPRNGPLEHLQITVGIAEGGDGAAANVMLQARKNYERNAPTLDLL